MSLAGEVTLIEEKECEVEWKIPEFLNHFSKKNCIYSPDFSMEGNSWWMGLYTNGRFKTSVEYIDLHLGSRSSTSSIGMDFSISIKTVNGKKDSERLNTGVFDEHKYIHDIGKLISRSDFDRRKSEFLASESLTVICTAKKLNSPENATECSYCKRFFDVEEIPSHEKKCRIKCPDCCNVILYRDWHEHECHTFGTEVDAGISESSTMPLKYKALQDYKELFLKQEDCDVIIKVKEEEFHAHRVILKARLPVLASTFRNDMKEKVTGVINIDDSDPSHISDFLYFLYSGEVENLTVKNVFNLFTLSDKYDIPDLRTVCIDFIKRNLSIESFCNTITLALLHSEPELLKLSTAFFAKNFKKIIVTVEWQSFIVENPIQGNEVFIKALVCDNDKEC